MAKSKGKQTKRNKAQQEEDKELAQRLGEVISLFHSGVLNKVVFITWLRVFVFILLILLGLTVARASLLSGLGRTTGQQKKKNFLINGFLSLFQNKSGCGRKSKTKEKQSEIVANLESHDYHSIAQIKSMVEGLIKKTISMSAVKSLLHKLGYKWLKAGSMPGKADPEQQKRFFSEVEKPLMEQAQKGKITLFFLDAAHFVLGNGHLGKIWCLARRWLSSFSGRQRHNVLGALNYMTKEILTITNDTYINSESILEMLEKIAAIYRGFPVYIILDNAKYQVCNAVRIRAEQLGIKLVFLPSYSPNLNFIERIWKFVKKQLSVSYFENFSEYKSKIESILSQTNTVYKKEMESLIGEDVQLFDGAKQKSPNSYELPKKQAKKTQKAANQMASEAA